MTLNRSQSKVDYTTYQIAGQVVLIDKPLAPLFAFQQGRGPHHFKPAENVNVGDLFYDEVVPIVNAWRRVRCWDGPMMHIVIDGVGQYQLHKQTQAIEQIACNLEEDAQKAEALLGLPFMLALALRNVFCLHASAVLHQNQALLFLGESGRGKSTLARLLCHAYPNQFALLADDIVPLCCGPQVKIATDFPQLKLGADAQPFVGHPSELPVRAVCILGEATPSVSIRHLNGVDSLLALVRHTVASRAFTSILMQTHFSYFANLSLPTFELSYPRHAEVVHRVVGQLWDVV